MTSAFPYSNPASFDFASTLAGLKIEGHPSAHPSLQLLPDMPAELTQSAQQLLFPPSPQASDYSSSSESSAMVTDPNSDEYDDEVEDGDNDSQSNKRKLIHAACDNCKRLKIRCDGSPTCQQCIKRGVGCVYSGSKKRGPKVGKLKQLQEQVEALSLIVRQQKQQLEQTPTSVAPPSQPPNKKRKVSAIYSDDVGGDLGLDISPQDVFFPRGGMVPPRPLPQMPSPSISHAMFILPEYVQVYKETIHPCTPVMRPVFFQNESLALVTRGLPGDFPFAVKAKASRALLNVYTVLGIGAWMQGNKEHSDEFMQRAVQYAREVFDETHYDTACGLDRLSYYFALLGNHDKAKNFNALALQMCDSLGLSMDSPLYTSCQLMRIKTSDVYGEKMAASKKLMEAGQSKAKVFGISGFVSAELTFNPARDLALLLQMLNSAELILDDIGNSPAPGPATGSPVGDVCNKKVCTGVPRITLNGLRSALYLHAGNVAAARHYADLTTMAMEQTDIRFLTFCTTVGLDFASQVHAETGAIDMLRRDAALLKAIIPKYPLAEKTLQKVNIMLDSTIARAATVSPKIQEIVDEREPIDLDPKPATSLPMTTPPVEEMSIEWVEKLLSGDDAAVAAMVPSPTPPLPQPEQLQPTEYYSSLYPSGTPASPVSVVPSVPNSPASDAWANWPSS